MHSGDCWPTAKYRTKLAAERLVALEKCGTLAVNYEPGRKAEGKGGAAAGGEGKKVEEAKA